MPKLHPSLSAPKSLRSAIVGPTVAVSVYLTAAAVPFAVRAETYTVTNLQDGNSVTGSLRDAINLANGHAGPDAITFGMTSGNVVLTEGQLYISDSVSITGAGNGNIVIDANHQSRAIRINNPNSSTLLDVALQGLTVQNANTTGRGGGLQVTRSNISLNQMVVRDNAASNGGGLYTRELQDPNVTISQTTFSGNSASNNGGGFYLWEPHQVEINTVTVTGNHSGNSGGGIRISDASLVSIQASEFNDNSAGDLGGGISLYGSANPNNVIATTTVSGNSALHGGGIHAYQVSTALSQITVANNTASSDGGGIGSTDGGNLQIVNATITANQAPLGAGLSLDSNAWIAFSTIANNGGTGAGLYLASGTVFLDSTVVAGNGNDVGSNSGTVNALYSLIQNANGLSLGLDSGNIKGQAAGLTALASNGGDIQTMLPSPTSPLLAAADPNQGVVPSTDARGAPRPSSGQADIGAVQLARCGSAVETASCTCENPCLTGCTCSAAGTCSGVPAANGTACTDGTCQSGTCVASGGGGTVTGGTTGTHSSPTTSTGGTTTSKKSGCAATPVESMPSLFAGLLGWWATRRRRR